MTLAKKGTISRHMFAANASRTYLGILFSVKTIKTKRATKGATMKITALVIAFLLIAGTAGAEEKRVINISKDKGFTEIQTKTNTIRVYPCGKVEKLVWKEINPNEESLTSTTVEGVQWGGCYDMRTGQLVSCD